jgi:hypothetical protein
LAIGFEALKIQALIMGLIFEKIKKKLQHNYIYLKNSGTLGLKS